MERSHSTTLGDDTEKVIFQAAKRVLVQNGQDATTMQQIADEAGISRTALHYYYRSKDRLFQAVLVEEVDRFLPHITDILTNPSLSLEEKLRTFIDSYLSFLQANPYLPFFIASTLHRDPDSILRRQINMSDKFDRLLAFLNAELGDRIDRNALLNFVVDLMGMLVFPFLARSMLKDQLLAEEDSFTSFVERRKEHVLQMLKGFLL